MKKLIRSIIRPIAMVYYRHTWRKKNAHNTTTAINRFHQEHVTVGKATYGPIEVLYDSGEGRLSIGNYCSIAQNVKFLLGGGIITGKSVLGPSRPRLITVMALPAGARI